MKVETYAVSGPIAGVCKQCAIWGGDGAQHMPLVYLQRPKWIKCDLAWERIVESIRLTMLQGAEIN